MAGERYALKSLKRPGAAAARKSPGRVPTAEGSEMTTAGI
jgi:hypothetical protein